ncbi:MAG TPA: T9SS type A sorting domain-containing protein, partial [Bacteroidia bacterium]|nr:T9SS type A sorting domain-containing protein [Bacteroidia bacterium]
PTSDGGFAIAGTFTNNITGMTALTLMKTDANGNFPCTFSHVSMSVNSSAATPTVLNVPIYTFTETNTANSLTFYGTTMNASQTDFCTLFGTNDQVANPTSISAFPSPIASGENLQLNVSGIEGTSVISIYDANGKVVKQVNREFSGNQNTTLEISTVDLNAGIYLVRITRTDQQVLGMTKFIVR